MGLTAGSGRVHMAQHISRGQSGSDSCGPSELEREGAQSLRESRAKSRARVSLLGGVTMECWEGGWKHGAGERGCSLFRGALAVVAAHHDERVHQRESWVWVRGDHVGPRTGESGGS